MIERYNKQDPKIVLTLEDIQTIEDMHTEFKIPLNPDLAKQINVFKEKADKVSIKDQERLRAFLALSVTTIQHELFQSEVFTLNVKEKAEKEWFEASFYLDLDEELAK